MPQAGLEQRFAAGSGSSVVSAWTRRRPHSGHAESSCSGEERAANGAPQAGHSDMPTSSQRDAHLDLADLNHVLVLQFHPLTGIDPRAIDERPVQTVQILDVEFVALKDNDRVLS